MLSFLSTGTVSVLMKNSGNNVAFLYFTFWYQNLTKLQSVILSQIHETVLTKYMEVWGTKLSRAWLSELSYSDTVELDALMNSNSWRWHAVKKLALNAVYM